MTDGQHDREPDDDVVDGLLDGKPAASPEEKARRAPYEQLIGQLGALPDIPPSEGWQVRFAQRHSDEVRAARRRRRLKLALIPLAAAALLLAWLLRRPEGGPGDVRDADVLAVRIERDGREVRGHVVAVGARAHIAFALPAPVIEVRVYRDERELILRCPGDAACGPSLAGPPRVEVGFTLDRAGGYRVIGIGGPTMAPAPSGSLDADLAALTAGGFVTRMYDVIDAR